MKSRDLFINAMEECAEVQQACSKCIRFGSRNHHPNRPNQTNGEDVMIEFYHICAIIEQLQNKGELPIFNRERISSIKSDKINRMKRTINKNS